MYYTVFYIKKTRIYCKVKVCSFLSNYFLYVSHKNLFRILGFSLVYTRGIKGRGEMMSVCLSSPRNSSGPGSGAGDSSAEGARASWRAEEEALRAGWGSRGLGRGRGG